MKARRITRWILLMGLVAGVALGTWAWQQRTRPQDQFAAALQALDDKNYERVSELRSALEGRAGFEEHARLLSGAVLLRNGKYELAYSEVASVSPLAALRSPALELMGECLYRMGRIAEAEPLMRQLVAENKDDANAHRWLGAIYYDMGANDLAIAEFERVSQLDPQDYRPHWMIGMMCYDFELFARAIEHYRQAVKLCPDVPVRGRLVLGLAKCLISERQFEDALDVLQDATLDADILALKTECYWSLGNQEQAQRLLQQAVKRYPTDRRVLYLQARMLIGDGRREEAMAPLQQVLGRNPLDAECRYQLALIYRQLGRDADHKREIAKWEESKSLLERLTELNIEAIQRPGDADVRDELASTCQKLGKHKLAEMWSKAADVCRKLNEGGNVSSPLRPTGKAEF